jgi:hypothetical protein
LDGDRRQPFRAAHGVPEYDKISAREQIESQAKARVGVSAKDINEARKV